MRTHDQFMSYGCHVRLEQRFIYFEIWDTKLLAPFFTACEAA
jgi:hypothetical protein